MNHELFAEFSGRWEGHQDKDMGVQVVLLCEGILDNRKRAQERLKKWILNKKLDEYFKKQKEVFNNLMYRLPDLKGFPPGSFTLQFTFYLDKPYMSMDDTYFYILDNPVKKEKIFKLPYVSPSQWKGTLRSAVRQMKGFKTWENEDEQMIRIFGNIRSEEERKNLRQGALYLYPTYFDQISLEVINPHERETGAGKNPIYFEGVPIAAAGVFSLLYSSFCIEDRKDTAKDLQVIVQGIQEMMIMCGFGAKVSSGFGRVERIEEGKLNIKVDTELEKTFESFEELGKKVKECSRILEGVK